MSSYDDQLSEMRRMGLSIDGDNAYKRDLLDSIVGALVLGKQGTHQPPPGHWAELFWDMANAEGAQLERLLKERDALLAERDAARMRIKELDLLFGRYLLAMKAAVIDSDQRGAEQGMRWIYNSLAGPGELPAEDEIDAQAFFDREIKPINDAMAELFAALQGEQP